MEKHPLCPLTKTGIETLQAMIDYDTDNTVILAEHLFIAPSSVRARFRTINDQLGTHSKGDALVKAIKSGWVKIPPVRQTSNKRRNGFARLWQRKYVHLRVVKCGGLQYTLGATFPEEGCAKGLCEPRC